MALRALAIWLLMMAVETVHGILRTLLLAPVIGDFRARQVSVFIASAIILAIAWLTIRWIGAATTRTRIGVGIAWVALTLGFEVGLGRLALGVSWERLLEDYDLVRGGLMPLGLLAMAFSPVIAHRLRRAGAARR